MPNKSKTAILKMTFEEYEQHRRDGKTHDEVVDIAGVSLATMGRANYGRRWRKLQADEEFGIQKQSSKEEYKRRRNLINAKRAQIEKARQSVIERYGSVNDAPAGSLEIKWLQKLNNDLVKMG